MFIHKGKGFSMETFKDYITSKLLRVTQTTLCRWRAENRYNIPYVKFSNRVLYKLSDIQEFLQKHQREGEKNVV